MIKLKLSYSLIMLTIFLFSCGGGGSDSQPSATTPVITTPAPTITFSSSSSSVELSNEFTLTWSSTNATSCAASEDWSGDNGVSGTQAITSTTAGEKSYVLTCTGEGGSATETVTVTILEPTPVLDVSVLYDPMPQDARAKYLIDIGTNRPKTTMTNTYFTATDIPQSTLDSVEDTLQATANWLGHYDVSYFLYGATYEGSESVALAYCDIWQYNNEIEETGCARFKESLIDQLGSGNANAASPGFNGTENDWGNPTVWSNPPNTVEHHASTWNLIDSAKVVIHEYVHIQSLRPLINIVRIPTSGRKEALPIWYVEGGAEFFAITAIDELHANNDYTGSISNRLNNVRANRYNLTTISARIKAFEDYGDDDDVDLAVFAVSHMVSLSSWQTVFMTLVNEIYTKGWEKAFSDNIGMTVDEFYADFETHMAMTDEAVMAAVPKPTKLEDVLTPTYPIPRLQIQGASNTANLGGQPTDTKKSIYVFKGDAESTPSYLGADWPYVTAEIGTSINKDPSVSAEISLSSTGYILSGSQPLYQYSQDTTDSSAKGDLINSKWHSVLPDGTSSDNLGFTPTPLPVN